MSQRSTEAFEDARAKIAKFINAPSVDEVIFTRGATEAINLVASSYGAHFLDEGDEIILSCMEHHSNIVPWQNLRDQKGIVIKIAPIDDNGNFLLDEFEKLLSDRTRFVSILHVSNVLGTVVPVREIVKLAHKKNAKVLIDGCQAVPHTQVNLSDLGADFYVFSGHKLYGPTGIGVLWAPSDILNSMPPYQFGGEMIERVTFDQTSYQVAPYRFEAGTPAITEAVGLGAAVDYVESIGLERIALHESNLLRYADQELRRIEGVRIIGEAIDKTSIISFDMADIHFSDIGMILDREGIAIRVGHHCAQPLMDCLQLSGTARASFGLYNTENEIQKLVNGLKTVKELFC